MVHKSACVPSRIIHYLVIHNGVMAYARWTWTLNNPAEYDPQAHMGPEVAYAIWQTERGADGTTHIQGYTRFHSRKRLNTVKNDMECPRLHLEAAKGNEAQNKTYCSKEATRVEGPRGEYGDYDPDAGTQGLRSDLTHVTELCRTGATMTQIATAHPGDYIRYHAGIEKLAHLIAPPKPIFREVAVWVLWGDTGLGKTHRVLTTYPDCYQVCGRGRDPWGQYRGQAVLLMDEFDPSLWTIQTMNGLLDKWRLLLDARYTDRYAEWTQIYICTNLIPTSWYADAPVVLRDSLRRRIARSCREVTSREPTLDEIKESAPVPDFSPIN
nr:MAG: replication associated protein [Cressdnaviricota sp.]